MPSVTRRAHATRADRRDEIRGRLLSAIERLLDEGESFTEVSVERITAEAGLSRSTFYVYFEDKGDLLHGLAAHVIDLLLEAAGRWWSLPPEADRDDVERALQALATAYRPHQTLLAAVVEASAYDQRVREHFAGLMRTAGDRLEAHIRAGQANGSIPAELAPDAVAGWLVWMAERGLGTLVRPADAAEADALVRALTAIVWNTLYRPARDPTRSAATATV
ncbi:Transcriptional regulator TetR family [Patulibacter medicamentivorans]|uniref:Transcriptional regulator TetR family n=1 Tax=Patulibacter medicamentivorans TaxID=1097667 RepID=H0E6R1_9ACTN|nr:TetR/AcrR family transcriptional regulator [Patulibacter medicamentivorans]EHN10624.1 Transcriptional regulator TetR family [Patulibacter medicamentivorans]